MNLIDQAIPYAPSSEFTRWVDPTSGQEFVLVPAEQYEKLRAIVDGMARRAGWDDPALDEYEHFRRRTPTASS
jgi:hypothetical protein